MLLTFIRRSFIHQKKSMLLMVASAAVGTALAASLLTISFEITGKVAKELRAFGANILIEPRVEGLAGVAGQKRYLSESDIVKAKTIFWRHNILGIAPFLEERAAVAGSGGVVDADIIGTWLEKELPVPGEKGVFLAGTRGVAPWWLMDGTWPDAPDEIVLGTALAKKLGRQKGEMLTLDGRQYSVTGILDTGGSEDSRIFMDLHSLQALKQKEGRVSKVLVSALTKPMDDFAYRGPETMTQGEYEKWYCTGYVTSIARQLEEVFQGSQARPIWQVAETEGRVLNSLRALIYILSFIAIAAAALGVSATMVIGFVRRRHEIGLMKAMGADRGRIVFLLLSEALIIGLAGGVIGYLFSVGVSRFIGMNVFHTGLEQGSLLFALSVGSSMVIAVSGSVLPIGKALRVKPGMVLKGAE